MNIIRAIPGPGVAEIPDVPEIRKKLKSCFSLLEFERLPGSSSGGRSFSTRVLVPSLKTKIVLEVCLLVLGQEAYLLCDFHLPEVSLSLHVNGGQEHVLGPGGLDQLVGLPLDDSVVQGGVSLSRLEMGKVGNCHTSCLRILRLT